MSLFSNSTSTQILTSFSLQLHFLLFLLINITQVPISCHGCHEQERIALLDFKFSLEDPANRLSSWKQGNKYKNCCNWHGIECSRDSSPSPHVISINLRNTALETYNDEYYKDEYFNIRGPTPNTSLHGKFSSSFVNITHLEYLDLGFNNFHESPIPFQFSELTKLMYLDLSHLNFSAPSSLFTNLSSIRYLDLSCGDHPPYSFDTYFCLESPSLKWLRGLVNLRFLRLGGIDLYEASFSEKNFGEPISYLSNLRDLDLSSCNITSNVFPIRDSHNLSRLSSLRMTANWELSSEIPAHLANFTSLSILDLSNCGLLGSIPYIAQLKELDVSSNYNLRPDLTRMFQHQWPKLQRLSTRGSNISGSIPSSISNAPVLVTLLADGCFIQGSLPRSIYNLSRLQSLDLSYNNITGHIHSSVSNLKSLHNLDLSTNNFQGSIPKSICRMVPLLKLSLHYNNMTGTIPSCISELRNLAVFDVSANSIGGSVSLVSLINALDLTFLSLAWNKITVVVDPNIHLYSKFKLQYLDLRSCNLKGVFPTIICELSRLYNLDLSHNHLTGVIPHCITKLKYLQKCYMFDNKLRDPLFPLPCSWTD